MSTLSGVGQEFPTYRLKIRSAFTLIEMLVVIGVIALLIAIVVPALSKARKTATATLCKANLSSIDTALKAYEADFKSYPTVDGPYLGFAVLGKAMFSPYGDGVIPGPSGPTPDNSDPPIFGGSAQAGDCARAGVDTYVCLQQTSLPPGPSVNEWAKFNVNDGVDGAGFRLRAGYGQNHRPYLQADKFKLRGLAVLDVYGNPILYSPARGAPKSLQVVPPPDNSFVADATVVTNHPYYNALDNAFFYRRAGETTDTKAIQRLQCMMGDTDFDGKLNNGQTARTTAPFMLWSAGADDVFAPTSPTDPPYSKTELEKCDDIIQSE